MSGSTSSALKCAAPACTTTVALVIRCASHIAWLTGEKLSTAPCQSRTGTLIEAGPKPPGILKAPPASIHAVPEQDRTADRGGVEAPGHLEGQHVVDPAVRRGAQGLGVGLQ